MRSKHHHFCDIYFYCFLEPALGPRKLASCAPYQNNLNHTPLYCHTSALPLFKFRRVVVYLYSYVYCNTPTINSIANILFWITPYCSNSLSARSFFIVLLILKQNKHQWLWVCYHRFELYGVALREENELVVWVFPIFHQKNFSSRRTFLASCRVLLLFFSLSLMLHSFFFVVVVV